MEMRFDFMLSRQMAVFWLGLTSAHAMAGPVWRVTVTCETSLPGPVEEQAHQISRTQSPKQTSVKDVCFQLGHQQPDN